MGTRGTRGEPFKYSEESMQKVLNERYMPDAKYITNNLYIFQWESDYAAKSRGGFWYEVEIKVTAADFKADFRKEEKHYILQRGYDSKGVVHARPNFFSYALPEDLIPKVKDKIPPYAGLISVDYMGRVENIKPPVLLHKEKIPNDTLRLTDKFYYNFMEYKNKYHGFAKTLKLYQKTINDLRNKLKKENTQTFDQFMKQLNTKKK